MSWLYTAPLWIVALVVVACVLAALEIGHRLARVATVTREQIGPVSASIIGVVGLMLAFSFGLAGERHAARRAAAVQECNSIGTFWLRTSLMPEPTQSEMRARVRRYVDLHIEHRRANIDEARLREIEAEVARLQSELWALLDADAERAPESHRLLLVTPALNDMIDDGATILAAKENRLPDALLFFLFLLVGAASVAIGYRPTEERRNAVVWGMFLLVLGIVLLILLDLDRPRRGLIQADTKPYERLRESLQ